MFKNMFKKLLSLTLALSFLFVTTVSASAANIPNPDSPAVITMDDFSDADIQFLNKFVGVLDGYYTSDTGVMGFSYTNAELANLGFTPADIGKLTEINSRVCGHVLSEDDTFGMTRVFIEDGKIWFDNGDIYAFLFAAASVGPDALYAAFVGLGTLLGGLVGTTITGILGFLGAASLSYLCYLIIQAAVNGQGIYIGVEMNGIFPNFVAGTW